MVSPGIPDGCGSNGCRLRGPAHGEEAVRFRTGVAGFRSSWLACPSRRGWLLGALAALVVPVTTVEARPEPPIEAITFYAEPGRLFVPLEEAASALRWRVERNAAGRAGAVNGRPFPPGSLRRLTSGAELASLEDLAAWGAVVTELPDGRTIQVRRGWRGFTMAAGVQRVVVSLGEQRMRAWQGTRLVLETRISSGRKRGSTPVGRFRAGPYRARHHFSSRYHNAPMPWSVQVHGHVFIHGFTSVPEYPASHGCIRVPLTGENPARFFYEWVHAGTPVEITP